MPSEPVQATLGNYILFEWSVRILDVDHLVGNTSNLVGKRSNQYSRREAKQIFAHPLTVTVDGLLLWVITALWT